MWGIPALPRSKRAVPDDAKPKSDSSSQGSKTKKKRPTPLDIPEKGKIKSPGSGWGHEDVSSDSDGAGTGVLADNQRLHLAQQLDSSRRRLHFTPMQQALSNDTRRYSDAPDSPYGLQSALSGNGAETKLTPIVVDAARLQRDPSYKQWYAENRADILEHNKKAFSSAAVANRQQSLRSAVQAAASSGRLLTPTGRLTASRLALSARSNTPQGQSMSPLALALPATDSAAGGTASQPPPPAPRTPQPRSSPATFVVDQERLQNDPAYSEWYEANKHKLEGRGLRSSGGGDPGANSTPASLLGLLRGGAKPPATNKAQGDEHEVPRGIDGGLMQVPAASTAKFVPDHERLRTDPEYRDWYNQYKDQLKSDSENPRDSEAEDAQISQFDVANPLRARQTMNAANAQAPAMDTGQSKFVVDKDRLRDDPEYTAWYSRHAHRLNSGFKSSALGKAMAAGRGRRRAPSETRSSQPRGSLSPLAAATTSIHVTSPFAVPTKFVVDQQRLVEDAGYRLWYEKHKHMLQ